MIRFVCKKTLTDAETGEVIAREGQEFSETRFVMHGLAQLFEENDLDVDDYFAHIRDQNNFDDLLDYIMFQDFLNMSPVTALTELFYIATKSTGALLPVSNAFATYDCRSQVIIDVVNGMLFEDMITADRDLIRSLIKLIDHVRQYSDYSTDMYTLFYPAYANEKSNKIKNSAHFLALIIRKHLRDGLDHGIDYPEFVDRMMNIIDTIFWITSE